MTKEILVTIFIPVYNGEKYLNNTLQSVKNQTYTNIEVLLVDDMSTDDSFTIIKEFANKDARFKVFQKPNGGMVAASWNYILPKVKGEYLFYMSQDDLISEDLIEKMVIRQNETHAQVVIPDLEFYHEGSSENKRIEGFFQDRTQIIKGRVAFLKSLNWSIHGFFLFDTKLVLDEIFPEDAFDSDEYMTRKIFLKTEKVAFSEGTFFYRQDNPNAITKKINLNHFYQLNTHLKILELIEENNFECDLIQQKKYELLRMFLQKKMQFSDFNFENGSVKNQVATFLNSFERYFSASFFKKSFRFKNLILSLKFTFVRLLYKNQLFLKVVGKFQKK